MRYANFLRKLEVYKGNTTIEFSDNKVLNLFVKSFKRYRLIEYYTEKGNLATWKYSFCRDTTQERESIIELLREEFTLDGKDIDKLMTNKENNSQ